MGVSNADLKRNNSIDVLKSILILLTVIGHAFNILLIYHLHMTLLFIEKSVRKLRQLEPELQS